MKHYKNNNNELYAFESDCFDEEGKCINQWTLKVIEENSLVEITEEESEVIRNYKIKEHIEEAERLSKEYEELKEAEELTTLYEKLSKLGVI